VTPARSVFALHGAPTRIPVLFTPIVPLFQVRWEESGLPGGTPWSVWVGGLPAPASGAWTTTHLSNGSWAYWVPDAGGYEPVNRSGLLVVSGEPIDLSVRFEPISFSVTISAAGLPGTIGWTLRIGGSDQALSGASGELSEPNGSYPWSIVPPSGYAAQPNHGTLQVSGGAVTLLVFFRPTGPVAEASYDPVVGTVFLLTTSAVLLIAMVAVAARARRPSRKPPTRAAGPMPPPPPAPRAPSTQVATSPGRRPPSASPPSPYPPARPPPPSSAGTQRPNIVRRR
jgi:hypothetical protein